MKNERREKKEERRKKKKEEEEKKKMIEDGHGKQTKQTLSPSVKHGMEAVYFWEIRYRRDTAEIPQRLY